MLTVAALTVFSLVAFQGYRVFTSDHELYIPPLYQTLNPELFQNDLLLSFDQTAYTFLDELIVFLMRALKADIFFALFSLTVVFRFIYFYSLYRIALYFTEDRTFSILSMFLFIGGSWVYGAAISTLGIYLTPRVVCLSLNLLFLACFLNGKRLLSTVLLGIGLLIHPISSLPFLIFFYLDVYLLSGRKRFTGPSFLLGAIPALFLALLLFCTESSRIGFFAVLDPIWESIIRFRAPQIFITSWDYPSFAMLIASACLFAISRLELREMFKNPAKKKYLYMLFLIPLFSFILSLISVDIFKMHFFAQLQASRSLVLWKIFIPLLFSYFAYKHIRDNPADLALDFSLAGIILSFVFSYPSRIVPLSFSGRYAPLLLFLPMFLFLWTTSRYNLHSTAKSKVFNKELFSVVIFAVSAAALLTARFTPRSAMVIRLSLLATLVVVWNAVLPLKRGLIYIFPLAMAVITLMSIPYFSIHPSYFRDKRLMEACEWIENNTGEQDIFITEPFVRNSGPLRLTCHRNVFTTRKDGAQATFRRNYAVEWKKRYELVDRLKTDNKLLKDISREYSEDYLISNSRLNTPYPLVFDNPSYCIYKLRQ